MVRPSLAICLLALSVLACDNKKAPTESAQSPKTEETKTEDEALGARRAAREKEQREREAAEEKRVEQIEALTIVPDDAPSDLKKACDRMTQAYDQYMQQVLEGDMLTKWKTGGNEMQITVFRKECLRRNAKVAACQAHALQHAPRELEKSLPELMKRCADEFGEKPN